MSRSVEVGLKASHGRVEGTPELRRFDQDDFERRQQFQELSDRFIYVKAYLSKIPCGVSGEAQGTDERSEARIRAQRLKKAAALYIYVPVEGRPEDLETEVAVQDRLRDREERLRGQADSSERERVLDELLEHVAPQFDGESEIRHCELYPAGWSA